MEDLKRRADTEKWLIIKARDSINTPSLMSNRVISNKVTGENLYGHMDGMSHNRLWKLFTSSSLKPKHIEGYQDKIKYFYNNFTKNIEKSVFYRSNVSMLFIILSSPYLMLSSLICRRLETKIDQQYMLMFIMCKLQFISSLT